MTSAMPIRCVLCLLMVLTVGGCAAALTGRGGSGPASDSHRGWRALDDGDPVAASASFKQALAQDSADARALFGAMNLAYERGDDAAAVGHGLTLLESASRGQDRLALSLAAATLSRVSRLLVEIPDRKLAEERLLAIAPDRMPWQAQYAFALLGIDIARKRADEPLLAKVSAHAGCVKRIGFVGTGGRLPYIDLASDAFVPGKKLRNLVPAGCQFQLNAPDNQSGIKVLRSDVALAGGRYDLVLDFSGPARMRVDSGPWHMHGGSLDRYGPRWSAQRVDLPKGKHTIELSIGTYSATSDLALLAIPVGESAKATDADEPDEIMMDLAAALLANLVGDVDGLLTRLDRLANHTRFSVGLGGAGRLIEKDPTRPADILRDKARTLWQRAVAIDPSLARVWLDLSNLEMQNDRPREATENAEQALKAAPTWWPAHLGLSSALRAQGLEQPADKALADGLSLVEQYRGACLVLEQAFQRAEDRQDHAAATRLIAKLAECDAQNDQPRYWAQKHGDLDKPLALLRRASSTTAEPLWIRSEIAEALLARGDLKAAQEILAELAEQAPRDTRIRVRLADIQTAMGKVEEARLTLARALQELPSRYEVRQAGRLTGLALPLDEFRIDGGQAIREFLALRNNYQAPAVVVLDRAIERVFPDGARLLLTHSITQVLSKDAIEHVGEVQVPPGAEVLALRTRKADGTLREAEEIAGKESISAPNLAVGDFVESEILEFKEPRDAFAPGFIGERFYFQSLDAPLDRSEYLFIAPSSMHLDVNRRADAPEPTETVGHDGTRILTFSVRGKPQVFPERSAVPAPEWIPSVRISCGIELEAWSRYVSDRFVRVCRSSAEIRRVAEAIAKKAGGNRAQLPEAIVAWVREHIEPESNFVETATFALARNRGNRAGLIIALAHSLGIPADLVLARSLLVAEADTPIVLPELDDFRDVLVRFPSADGDRFVDPLIRRAPFSYLLPAFAGAPAVVVGTKQVVKATSGVKDNRSVTLRARLGTDGAAKVAVTEQVSGWPAVEWTELLEHTGKDRAKLRQEFEQRWLGHHFPGAQLDTLSIEPGEGSVGTRVSYTFKAEGMAARQAGVLRLRPGFFQSQPGRRFGTEPQRKTALQLGFDIPLSLDAEIELPKGAKVIELGQGGDIITGEARFSEERSVNVVGEDPPRITLRRHSRLPLMRVLPRDYQSVAAKLRTVDPIEQGEIRFSVPGK
jgi:tetratricopeptide (TPR) repeat protein